MPLVTYFFDEINISAQVGDILHFSNMGVNSAGFDHTALQNTYAIGPIVNITHVNPGWNVTADHIDLTSNVVPPPAGIGPLPTLLGGEFMSFSKDKRENTSSLVGYYASINFVNNSRDKVELFSVGSEISESSK